MNINIKKDELDNRYIVDVDSYPSLSILKIQSANTYLWAPQLDISTFELALCIPILLNPYNFHIETLPPYAKRHWKLHEH
jgi:hypothetical protein